MTETTDTTEAPRVERSEERSRYEIYSGGKLAGFTEFVEKDPNRLLFPHTEVDDAFQGQGLAAILAGGALADAASRGKTIVPVCSYIVKYAQTHDIPGAVVDYSEAEARTEAGSA